MRLTVVHKSSLATCFFSIANKSLRCGLGVIPPDSRLQEAGRRIRSQNRALIAEQHAQKTAISRVREETVEAKRLCERQMVELEGQMKDLNFYIRTQHEVRLRKLCVLRVPPKTWLTSIEESGGNLRAHARTSWPILRLHK